MTVSFYLSSLSALFGFPYLEELGEAKLLFFLEKKIIKHDIDNYFNFYISADN